MGSFTSMLRSIFSSTQAGMSCMPRSHLLTVDAVQSPRNSARASRVSARVSRRWRSISGVILQFSVPPFSVCHDWRLTKYNRIVRNAQIIC